MLSCHKATQLMSEGQERPLGSGEKLLLALHTMMCKGCRNFERQLPVIRSLSRAYVAKTDNDTSDKPEDGPTR
ncbi:zf-HC2 domain-containing protein [uncultured Oceanisphaera sp.]|uniref:anti-sigma factor family protein n=1 Tax=uncultured Oceanisphaera sp. TaxID=353858 RepID=UPI002618E6A0|nr:zf-HC2 domain-containing protein [uncultured Oceanisphaera sp.]